MWRFLLAALITAAALPVADASASQLIDRDVSDVQLATNSQGEALLTYHSGGKLKHVLAWGAVNAIAPTRAGKQVAFKLDYAGGYGKYKRAYWKTFGATCNPYDGPTLGWLLQACTAPDGSYWALQQWQRALPNYGVPSPPSRSVWELHLSHWTGEPAVLTVKTDWAYRTFDHIYGSLTYNGGGVYGFKSTRFGVPLDTFGRNLYVDTLDSAYGAGWKRENSFLMHSTGGTFCYGFFKHGTHPIGKGTAYRATIIGPGVTPDLFWEGSPPGAYDKAADQVANDEQRATGDPLCKPK